MVQGERPVETEGRRVRPWFHTLVAVLVATGSARGAQVQDPSFAIDVIHTGVGMVPLTFGPGARLYVGEKMGRILVFEPEPGSPGEYLAPQVFASLESDVNHAGERGLLGLCLRYRAALPPQLFAFYSYSGGQRVVRFDVDDSTYTTAMGPPVLVLDGLVNQNVNHNGGDITFWDGALYILLGDDLSPSLAQNLDVYNGKILRVDENGFGLSSNPFYDGDVNSRRSRIWGLGCRNPFRFVFHRGAMYVSENGNSIDRISRWGAAGANGGWPDEFTEPSDSNVVNLFTRPPSVTGIAIASGGQFADPAFPQSDVVYVGNHRERSIRRWRLTGAQLENADAINIGGGNAFITGLSPPPVDMIFGPDGLYVTTTWRAGDSGKLYRIRPTAGVSPTAVIGTTPDPAIGPAPLTVDFVDLSSDDRSIVSWLWDFDDGDTSSQQSPSHTFDAPGVYSVTLTVTDELGLTDTTTVDVTTNQATIVELSGTIFDGRDIVAQGLPVSTELRLYQLDGLTPLSFPGGGGALGNAQPVPVGGQFNFAAQVELTDCGMVVSAGEQQANGLHAAFRGIAITCDSPSHAETLDFYLSSAALSGRVADTLGMPARVDLGVSRSAPGSLFAIAGGRDFLPPVPFSGVAHRVESDDLGYYYIPIPSAAADTDFHIDVVGDTSADLYLSTRFTETVPSGALVLHDVTLGLQEGGADCGTVPGPGGPVKYDEVQAIFDARCIGCHSGLDPNARLDLSQGVSYDSVVDGPSGEVPGLKLVEPGDSSLSFLWEKVNCSLPQVGVRMPTGVELLPSEQVLIRDWIDQGALPSIAPPQISCPGDIVATGAPSGGAVVNYQVTVESDDDSVALVCDLPSGSVLPSGRTTVTCAATDFLSQVAACSFDVTVEDLIEFQRGDTNEDGFLDVSDIVTLLRQLFDEYPTRCQKSADVDDTGTISITDALFLVKSLFGGGPLPPDPLGDCGVDLTTDDLTCESYSPCGV